MLKLTYTRRTFYVGLQDEQAIATIREKYGLGTDSDAVRVALRLVAESPVAQVQATKKKTK